MRVHPALPLALILAAACGSDGGSNPVRTAMTQASATLRPGSAVAFRFPPGTGRERRTTLYRLPGLAAVAWRFEAGPRPTRAVVGFAADQDLVYALDAEDDLIALDLTSGRVRVADSNVALAALGPTGTIFAVHRDGSVASIALRSITAWPNGFSAPPSVIWGAQRDRLIGVVASDRQRTLELLAEGQTSITQPIPEGDVTVSSWGDLAAISTDSGVALLDPAEPGSGRFLRVRNGARFSLFSPSAHRLYVVDRQGRLHSVDRFSLDVNDRLDLPGVAAGGTMDPWGRLLLLRPETGDSIWPVDLITWGLRPTLGGEWGNGLPLIGPDGSILVRRGGAVAGIGSDGRSAAGAVDAAPGDWWLAGAWDPRRPVLEAVAEEAVAVAPASPGAAATIYVQVSSTSNPEWAEDLAGNLRRAGMRASVLPPDRADEPYRVVLGPFATREEAEAAGRDLGVPFWIFDRDSVPPTP